jgi:hypothetical protein
MNILQNNSGLVNNANLLKIAVAAKADSTNGTGHCMNKATS